MRGAKGLDEATAAPEHHGDEALQLLREIRDLLQQRKPS
jgi:hypothetical protein